MPDFERVLDSLELHCAKTTEDVAFIRGKHAGKYFARFQILKIIIGFLLVLAVYAWAGTNDFNDQQAAEAHAKHVQQLAQREAAEQKAEFNFLAKKAERMTGFAGVTSK